MPTSLARRRRCSSSSPTSSPIRLLEAVTLPFTRINLPLGLAAMFLGTFTVVVRREAVPQLLGSAGGGERRLLRRHRHRAEPAGDRRAGGRGRRSGRRPGGRHADAAHPRAARHDRRRPACRVCGSSEAMELAAILVVPVDRQRPLLSPLGRRFAAPVTVAAARIVLVLAVGIGGCRRPQRDASTRSTAGSPATGSARLSWCWSRLSGSPRRCSPGAISRIAPQHGIARRRHRAYYVPLQPVRVVDA